MYLDASLSIYMYVSYIWVAAPGKMVTVSELMVGRLSCAYPLLLRCSTSIFWRISGDF